MCWETPESCQITGGVLGKFPDEVHLLTRSPKIRVNTNNLSMTALDLQAPIYLLLCQHRLTSSILLSKFPPLRPSQSSSVDGVHHEWQIHSPKLMGCLPKIAFCSPMSSKTRRVMLINPRTPLVSPSAAVSRYESCCLCFKPLRRKILVPTHHVNLVWHSAMVRPSACGEYCKKAGFIRRGKLYGGPLGDAFVILVQRSRRLLVGRSTDVFVFGLRDE